MKWRHGHQQLNQPDEVSWAGRWLHWHVLTCWQSDGLCTDPLIASTDVHGLCTVQSWLMANLLSLLAAANPLLVNALYSTLWWIMDDNPPLYQRWGTPFVQNFLVYPMSGPGQKWGIGSNPQTSPWLRQWQPPRFSDTFGTGTGEWGICLFTCTAWELVDF